MNHREIGTIYEQKAVEFLKQKSYTILECNYTGKQGEIDIIARQGRYLVFVEVKYRADLRYGSPEEAVDYRKQHRISQTAKRYLSTHHMSEFTPCRFDVVLILGDQIRLIENAFDAV